MPFNRAALESVDSGGDAPSINSILLDILAVKGNFLKSSRDTSEMTYAEILAEQAALRARQEQVKAKENAAMNNPELLSAMDSYTEMFSELRNLLGKKHRGEASDADIERISEIKNSREETLKKSQKYRMSLG